MPKSAKEEPKSAKMTEAETRQLLAEGLELQRKAEVELRDRFKVTAEQRRFRIR